MDVWMYGCMDVWMYEEIEEHRCQTYYLCTCVCLGPQVDEVDIEAQHAHVGGLEVLRLVGIGLYIDILTY
jgi:hypothetical protein